MIEEEGPKLHQNEISGEGLKLEGLGHFDTAPKSSRSRCSAVDKRSLSRSEAACQGREDKLRLGGTLC